jgi:hypothetical protein
MRAMGLDKIRETAGAADTGHSSDFLVPDLALLDQLEVKRQDGKITATGAPGGMIGDDFFLGKAFAIAAGEDWRGNAGDVAVSAIGNFGFGFAHWFK